MLPVVAIHKISRNPTGRMEATGRYDAHGNMIMRSKGETITPGTIFEIEEGEELTFLRGHGSVRDLTDEEMALWQRQSADQ